MKNISPLPLMIVFYKTVLLLCILTIYACSSSKSNISNVESGIDKPVFNLKTNSTPSENFDLNHWKITLSTGEEKTVKEINDGFTLQNQFYTDSNDGGMVFKNYPKGAGTTTNSTYSRVELREMLRGSDSKIKTHGINGNNWILSSSNEDNKSKAGAVDGVLEATLKINRVTETSDNNAQVGRIIIGQIHASDDEPIRLYYHKQPEHRKGAIYFAHEPRIGRELFINLLGSYIDEKGTTPDKYNGADSPHDGIALNEMFSYKIEVKTHELMVSIFNEKGKILAFKSLDMSRSGYANDWLYFKAGIYSGNKTVKSSSDYEQVTYYKLNASH